MGHTHNPHRHSPAGSGVWEREGGPDFLFVPRISCPGKPQYFPLPHLTFRERELDEGSRGCTLSPRWPPRRRMNWFPPTPGHSRAQSGSGRRPLGSDGKILTSLGWLRGPRSYFVRPGEGRRTLFEEVTLETRRRAGSARAAAGRGRPGRREPRPARPVPAVIEREVQEAPGGAPGQFQRCRR